MAPKAKVNAEGSGDGGVASPKARQLSIAPPPIDYKRLLALFFAKYDKTKVSTVDSLLQKHAGKEPKLMLMLARKYDASNPLNGVFKKAVTNEHLDDNYEALTQLYLSVFYPQDVAQAEALCSTYKGREQELFKKLSSNFCAVNPLKMKDDANETTDESTGSQPVVDYKELLTAFFREHDEEKVPEAEAMLSKCPKGKEEILFSVLASQYKTSNALNSVFEEKLKAKECKDHASLLHLYFSVFHPSKAAEAKSMLSKYQGKEGKLFSLLAAKFRGVNPLDACNKMGKKILGSIDESDEKEAPAVIDDGDKCASPKRSARRIAVPESPAVTP